MPRRGPEQALLGFPRDWVTRTATKQYGLRLLFSGSIRTGKRFEEKRELIVGFLECADPQAYVDALEGGAWSPRTLTRGKYRV